MEVDLHSERLLVVNTVYPLLVAAVRGCHQLTHPARYNNCVCLKLTETGREDNHRVGQFENTVVAPATTAAVSLWREGSLKKAWQNRMREILFIQGVISVAQAAQPKRIMANYSIYGIGASPDRMDGHPV